jgi:hypothetical protein
VLEVLETDRNTDIAYTTDLHSNTTSLIYRKVQLGAKCFPTHWQRFWQKNNSYHNLTTMQEEVQEVLEVD